MPITIPANASPEVQEAFRQISDALDVIMGPRNVDWRGRRVINAGDAVQDQDYVTLAQLNRILGSGGGTGGSSSSSSTSGGGSGAVDNMMQISLRG